MPDLDAGWPAVEQDPSRLQSPGSAAAGPPPRGRTRPRARWRSAGPRRWPRRRAPRPCRRSGRSARTRRTPRPADASELDEARRVGAEQRGAAGTVACVARRPAGDQVGLRRPAHRRRCGSSRRCPGSASPTARSPLSASRAAAMNVSRSGPSTAITRPGLVQNCPEPSVSETRMRGRGRRRGSPARRRAGRPD